jgi:hypothetical protein
MVDKQSGFRVEDMIGKEVLVISAAPVPMCAVDDKGITVGLMSGGKPLMEQMFNGKLIEVDPTGFYIVEHIVPLGDRGTYLNRVMIPVSSATVAYAEKVEAPKVVLINAPGGLIKPS